MTVHARNHVWFLSDPYESDYIWFDLYDFDAEVCDEY